MSEHQSFQPKEHRQRPAAHDAIDLSKGENSRTPYKHQNNYSRQRGQLEKSPPPRKSAFATRNRPSYIASDNNTDKRYGSPNRPDISSARGYAIGREANRSGSKISSEFVDPAELKNNKFGAPKPSVLPKRHKIRRVKHLVLTFLVLLLVFVIAWPVGMYLWGNSLLEHTQALNPSSQADDSGSTFLIIGTDKRSSKDADAGLVSGGRADSIILLHVAPNGQAATVSIPRDTLVTVPGKNEQAKINATYSYGGEPMLAQAIESLSGMKVDHVVVVTMDGVSELVDAVGGIDFCMDRNVDDHDSGLHWEAGCHHVNGVTALQLARERHADSLGDFGRAQRQREIIALTVEKAAQKETFINPFRQIALMKAGTGVLSTDPDTGIGSIGYLAWYYRQAGKAGLSGLPPVKDMGYFVPGLGSTVLLDDELGKTFWGKMREGTLTKEDYNSYG